MGEHHRTGLVSDNKPVNSEFPEFHVTLALRCRHASQARDVYFLPGRLRLAGSSSGARVVMAPNSGAEYGRPVFSVQSFVSGYR